MTTSKKNSLPPRPTPPPVQKQCQHPRQGIVTNQPGSYDETRLHAWRICCDAPECIKIAAAWVKIITKESATFRRD